MYNEYDQYRFIHVFITQKKDTFLYVKTCIFTTTTHICYLYVKLQAYNPKITYIYSMRDLNKHERKMQFFIIL